jgi:Cd2+/Zn2+-exporting ATPase/Cu+-exporting ATPase
MSSHQTVEIPVRGLDCAECAQHVRTALEALPGVETVDTYIATEKAVVSFNPIQVDVPTMHTAIKQAGYDVPATPVTPQGTADTQAYTRRILALLGVVFGVVLFIVVIGEGLHVFDTITERIPWPIALAAVLAFGFPIFRGVIQSALRGKITSHTLMTIGAIAAMVVGEWVTAAIVVFFMRTGEYTERFTTEQARRALKDLTALAPQKARVERDGEEREVPLTEIRIGDTVIVRPGEQIPVDGEVIGGQATVNQATITGEAMPVEVGVGATVYAATIAQLGSIRVRVTHVGADTTFGRIIKLVEEAEAHRADVQRIADVFSTYYLPVVAAIAVLTFLIRHDPLATAAVLVVACSCSFALATPVAMLASIGASARRGLLIKGGKYIEALARADVLLIDKTGTLTLGQPQVADVIAANGYSENELLSLAASAERYSEHPLAEAVRQEAKKRQVMLAEPRGFTAVPGMGVRAQVNGNTVAVGNRRFIAGADTMSETADLEAQGKTLLFVGVDEQLAGIVAASDTLRPEVPQALAAVRQLGIQTIELLTGDNERTAATLAGELGVQFRANLLPEDKITIVKDYQARGHRVIMVGDGVNDAPALAQADIGIAMGAAGTDVAIEAAHIALMRDDWRLIPDVLQVARRTMQVVKFNIAFTVVYNFGGLFLAAVGILPPVLAAAAQSLPDIGILGNSARLLRQRKS